MLLHAPLSREIHREYTKLRQLIDLAPADFRFEKAIKRSTGGDVSIPDLIAYQIGWGKAVIRWYHAGLNSEIPVMPGDGFTEWNYTEIVLNKGEFFIVPKGIEHLPYANEKAHVLLFEPKEVINTGDATSEKTVANPEWI